LLFKKIREFKLMKKLNLLNMFLIFSMVSAFALTGCAGGGSDNGEGMNAGDIETYAADGVSFNMAYVPGSLTFPIGVNDDGTATVTNAYLIGETEVTWELWKKVYDWALLHSYYFANAGMQGDNGSRGIQHPVTNMNWRDCIVWCNALTEWYNAQKGTTYECVYTYSSTIIRNSRNSNATACDGAVAGPAANGFRLLLTNEFELAARYRNGTIWTYGDHASGDDSGACFDDGAILGGLGVSTVFGDYAVYCDNSSSTAAVKSKLSNALGLYDMSGNVSEWCFDFGWETERVTRDGSYLGLDSSQLRVGKSSSMAPELKTVISGFRFARTQ
jgi:hypothetical protein